MRSFFCRNWMKTGPGHASSAWPGWPGLAQTRKTALDVSNVNIEADKSDLPPKQKNNMFVERKNSNVKSKPKKPSPSKGSPTPYQDQSTI